MTDWARRLAPHLEGLDGIRARQRRHARRALMALRRSGPGPMAGEVLGLCCLDDVLIVQGWVNLKDRPVQSVVVSVDGSPVGVSAPGEGYAANLTLPETDRRTWPAAWAVTVDRSRIAPGDVEFGATAIVSGGLAEPLEPIRVNLSERLAGALDEPSTGEVVHPPTVLLRGWALSSLGLDRVEVSVNGGPRQRARVLADPRPDIGVFSGNPVAAIAGWHLTVEIPEASPGETLEITAVARDQCGEMVLGTTEVIVGESSYAEPADPAWIAALQSRVPEVSLVRRAAGTGVRCLVFTHDLGLGGGQLYLSELLRVVLRQSGVTCTVLAPRDGPLRRELESQGATVHVAGDTPTDAVRYESRMTELVRLAAELEPNIVLANTAGSFMGVDLAGRCGLPSVWAIHESYTPDQFLAAAYGVGAVDAHIRRRFTSAFSSATAVVFEADATLQHYVPLGEPSRFLRVDYGIPLGQIDEYRSRLDRDRLRAERGFGDTDDVVVCLGTFEPRKNQTSLLAAFERVSADFPAARLVLVGDTGIPYARSVRELVERLGLEDRVRIEPVTPQTYSWYGTMDLFVCASDVESLPRSVLEAMAFGVPVLATAVYGLPELIDDGVNGLLCAPLDIGALADGLARLLSLTPDERSKLGREAESRVRFSRDAPRYGHVYHRLLEGLALDPDADPRTLTRDD